MSKSSSVFSSCRIISTRLAKEGKTSITRRFIFISFPNSKVNYSKVSSKEDKVMHNKDHARHMLLLQSIQFGIKFQLNVISTRNIC